MNHNEFIKPILFLQSMYGRTIPDAVINQYWEILKTMQIDKWDIACNNVIKTFVPTSQVPFPLIPHFLTACGESGHTKAVAAIAEVKRVISKFGAYATVDFRDRILHGVIERFGGWVTVCNWTHKDWQFNERNFIDAYEAAQLTGEKGSEVLYGIVDNENETKNNPVGIDAIGNVLLENLKQIGRNQL